MGVPFFGFDWHGGTVSTVSAHRGAALAASYHVAIGRDPSSQEATLRFADAGVKHSVYFQDQTAVAAKLAALRAHHPKIAGISTWVMSLEAPGFWPLIARKLR
jgi:spore germination protein YaaH